MDQRYFKYVVVLIMTYDELRKSLDFVCEEKQRIENKLIILQQRNFDLQDKIYTAIAILNKGDIEKAIKILKKVLYEK